MLRKKEDRICQIIPNTKGRSGEFRLFHIVETSEMEDRTAMFAVERLLPGASVGIHRHRGAWRIQRKRMVDDV